ncbi:hypothetical protein [[Mycobacterium] nativiensis]|uniref:Molecular chaperone n=1 Tax=[Mycobacterium] nativiensis TaxID=2855503 RepID=A0ABU5XWZ3_9MYCO|nr:hypothetical protein [Mycolicibacter sp. MYC340]MEB3032303.1 hypothetical protein [Mycolicibacter sp. MYC340]
MYDPQADDVTREADAIGATEMAPTVPSGPGTGVVDAYAWSQEDGSAGAEPVPYVEDPYDHAPATGWRPATTPPPAPVPGRSHPSRLPRYALGFGILVALIAIAGALYSLTRITDDDTPVQPETSAVVEPLPSSTPSPMPAPVPPPEPSTPAPPPVATTVAPPPETTTAPPETTTAPPTTTTTVPPTTTTTAPHTTTTTAPPTTTPPPSTTAPPPTTAPPTTTVPMTTEYLRIPLVPIPIPITVPEN